MVLMMKTNPGGGKENLNQGQPIREQHALHAPDEPSAGEKAGHESQQPTQSRPQKNGVRVKHGGAGPYRFNTRYDNRSLC